MPWARIPADRLIHLPLFGIDVVQDDGEFLWMRGPSGRMHVCKKLPRIFFESVADAHQAGAVDIRIGSEGEEAEFREYNEQLEREANTIEDGNDLPPDGA